MDEDDAVREKRKDPKLPNNAEHPNLVLTAS